MSTATLHRVMSSPKTGTGLVAANAVSAGYNVGTAYLTGTMWNLWLAAFNIIAAVLCGWSYRRLRRMKQAAAEARASRELTIDELERELDGAWSKLAQTVERAHADNKKLATDRVEAYTYCPFCGKQAVHSMRAARKRPKSEPGYNRYALLMDWGFQRDDQPPKLGLHDEYHFEIVRTCNCGAEWGQR